MTEKNRAWFLARGGTSLWVIYDSEKNKSRSYFEDFKFGKAIDLQERGKVYFNIKKPKNVTLEKVLKFDFLPNNTGVMLASKKALALLEKEAKGEFQAVPAEITMPDGYVIKDYHIINITNRIKMRNEEKTIIYSEFSNDNRYYYHLYGLGDLQLARADEDVLFFISDKLKKIIEKAKLKGLAFYDAYARNYYFYHDEDSYTERVLLDVLAEECSNERMNEAFPYTKERKEFMEDILQSFPEIEKYRIHAKKGEVYNLFDDLRSFKKLLINLIGDHKNKLVNAIFDKVEQFLQSSDKITRDIIKDYFCDDVICWYANDQEYHKYLINTSRPLIRECFKELANRKKIKMKIPGLN